MTQTKTAFTTLILSVVLTSLAFSVFAAMPAQAHESGEAHDHSKMEKKDKARSLNSKRKSENGTSTRPMAERATKRASSTKTVDSTCMQGAVNTREEAIMTAFETYSASTLAAMDKRQKAFAAVWTDSTIKNTAKYNEIWSAWKKDAEAARKSLQTGRKDAWKTFRTTASQSCKATLPKAEVETQENGTTAI